MASGAAVAAGPAGIAPGPKSLSGNIILDCRVFVA